MILENMWWRWQHDQMENTYFLYGLDREAASFKNYLPHPEFARLRDSCNADSYSCTVNDKFIFAQLVSSLGYDTPRNIALLEPGGIEWFSPRCKSSLDTLLEREVEGICKPLSGGQGRGIFFLDAGNGEIKIDGKPASIKALRARITEPYLLQERLDQHEALRALHPSSINTLRLITVRQEDEVRLLASVLRVGSGGSRVDNWSAGGLIACIDPEDGTLCSHGFFKKGPHGNVSHHPDSGIQLNGYRIAHFHDAVELVRAVHRDLKGLYTVGWDVAVTSDGPSLLEGNDTWDGSIPMTVVPGFKEHFVAAIRRRHEHRRH